MIFFFFCYLHCYTNRVFSFPILVEAVVLGKMDVCSQADGSVSVVLWTRLTLHLPFICKFKTSCIYKDKQTNKQTTAPEHVKSEFLLMGSLKFFFFYSSFFLTGHRLGQGCGFYGGRQRLSVVMWSAQVLTLSSSFVKYRSSLSAKETDGLLPKGSLFFGRKAWIYINLHG